MRQCLEFNGILPMQMWLAALVYGSEPVHHSHSALLLCCVVQRPAQRVMTSIGASPKDRGLHSAGSFIIALRHHHEAAGRAVVQGVRIHEITMLIAQGL